MKWMMGGAVRFVLLAGVLTGPAAVADSVYTIANPPVDFQVIDADDGSGEYFFDGIGDFGPFSTFGDVALGTTGEARSIIEFDLSGFAVPAGEIIVSATLEVRYTSVGVFGLGINGEHSTSLAVDGYIGNGMEEISDFQIANGNVLAVVPTPTAQVGDIVTFYVTPFIAGLVNAGHTWAGLTVRAEVFGGDQFWEAGEFPKLTIQTAIPEPGTLMLCLLAGLAFLRRR